MPLPVRFTMATQVFHDSSPRTPPGSSLQMSGYRWIRSAPAKRALRAGAELIYDQVNFFTGQRVNQNPPFATAVSQTQTTTSGPISFQQPVVRGRHHHQPLPQPSVPNPADALFFPQSQYCAAAPISPCLIRPGGQRAYSRRLAAAGNSNSTTSGTIPCALAHRSADWGSRVRPRSLGSGGGVGCTGVVLTGPGRQATRKGGWNSMFHNR